jgi:serine/threonine-protein phosphatase 2A regulatory subunit A
MSTEGLYPIALLVDEMKSEDIETRVNAMKRLKTIAVALGNERCRTELIPFLTDQVEDDDEVLLVMAQELGEFVDLVGGPPYAVCLVELLGALATVEETVVREQAVKSARRVIEVLSPNNVVTHVVPVIDRLTNGDWFTARVSACGLFGSAYKRLTDAENKAALRRLFAQLCNDDTPMVRRAAAHNLGGFATEVEPGSIMEEIVPLFNQLSADDQDSVRLLAIENCTALAKRLGEAENHSLILPLVKSCAEDKSWRVRNNVAKEFHPLSQAMGVDVTVTQLLPLFVKLLQDPEAEVRAAAAKNAAGYCDLIGPDKYASDVFPALHLIAEDAAPNVRAAVADAAMDLASKVGNAHAMDHVVRLAMLLLRDEFPETRLKVLEKLENLSIAIGADAMHSTVLPIVIALGADGAWRVRKLVVEKMPLLASVLGAATFEDRVMDLYLNMWHDPVCDVRRAATAVMEGLGTTLGAGWCAAKLVPRLRELFDQDNGYLQRITVLYGVQGLSKSHDMAALATDLLPIVLRAARDPVPNVRFVAAQTLDQLIPILDGGRVSTEVKPALQALAADSDPDASWFAMGALQKC